MTEPPEEIILGGTLSDNLIPVSTGVTKDDTACHYGGGDIPHCATEPGYVIVWNHQDEQGRWRKSLACLEHATYAASATSAVKEIIPIEELNRGA